MKSSQPMVTISPRLVAVIKRLTLTNAVYLRDLLNEYIESLQEEADHAIADA